MANTVRYLLRNATAADWTAKNPILAKGEPGYDSTANRLKFGNAATAWNDLPYLAPDVINDLTTGGADKALSAEQGKTLKTQVDAKLNSSDVVNNLTSTSTTAALSAAQGKMLKDLIDGIPSGTTSYGTATQSSNGLMSAADKKKLDGIATGATKYTHPSYTARTGVPTSNQTPSFGGTFTVSQVTSDASGHVTGMNSRTITIPGAEATTSAKGLMSAADKTKLNGITTETWTFTLSSGSTVTKKVAIM